MSLVNFLTALVFLIVFCCVGMLLYLNYRKNSKLPAIIRKHNGIKAAVIFFIVIVGLKYAATSPVTYGIIILVLAR